MAVPEFYDDPSIRINVNPDDMFQSATKGIPNLGGQIADSINRIVGTWNDLKLGWIGNTAEEAKDFNDRWAAAISELFGTKAEPDSGLLSQIANGIAMASLNYGGAEDVVTNMFTKMAASLADNGSSDTPPDPHRGVNDAPITENTPNMPSKGRVDGLPTPKQWNPFDVGSTPPATNPNPQWNPMDPSSTPPPPDPNAPKDPNVGQWL
jgi:hypothetical protein